MGDRKAELTALVGKGNVLDDAATLDSYSKDESFAPPLPPQCVVKPQNVDEVQRIVALCG